MLHGRPRALFLAITTLVLLACAAPAQAVDPVCDKTWDGSNGSWHDAGKWSPSGVPSGSQRACLPAGSYAVSVSSPTSSGGFTVGAGVTLTVDDGTTLNAQTNSVINRGTVQLDDGAILIAGLTTNEGVIEETGTVTTIPRLVSPLDNTGTLRANQSLQVWPGGGAVTNQPAGTITTLTSTSVLTFINAGTITLNGTVTNPGAFNQSNGKLVIGSVAATGSPIVLTGSPAQLDASGTGTAQVRATTTVDLVGNIGANVGVTVYSDGTNGGNLRLDADRTNNGTLTMESVGVASDVHINAVSGTPRLTNLGDLDVKAGAGGARFLRVQLTNGATGDVHVFPNIVLTVDTPGFGATYTTSGDIVIDAAAALTVSGCCDTVSFTQTAGTITANGTFQQSTGTHVHQGGTVLGAIRMVSPGNPPAIDPSGPGGPTFDIRGAVRLLGDIHEDASVVLLGTPGVGASLAVATDRTNAGLLRLDSNVEVGAAVTGGATLTNTGTLEVLAGAGGDRSLSVGVDNQGFADIRATTVVNRDGSNVNPSFVTSGTVELDPNVTLNTRGGYRQTAGSTDLGGGTIFVSQSPGLTDIQGGVLRGGGGVYGPLRNAAEVSPGRFTAPYGLIHVQSSTWQFGTLNGASYEQTAAGVLAVDVNGTTPGTAHDQIKVDGPATLAGDLEVANAPGFTPDHAAPDRMRVIDAQSRSGTFGPLTGPDSDNYEVEYVDPHVELKAVDPGPPPVRMSIEDAETTEGNAGTKTLTFAVKLNQASASTVTAHWQTVADTATAPSDFTAVADAVVTFAPGETQKNVGVTIAGDTATEPIEAFLVRLRDPGEARLGVARATGRILSDDLGITSVRPPVAGDKGTVTITVRGGDFVAGSTVTLKRTGSPDVEGEVVDRAADGSRILARFRLDDVDLGDYDVVVTKPGVGGASATEADGFAVIDGGRPRIAVQVSVPSSQRYGWAGRATVSLRNEGTNDAGVDMVRIRGTDVELSLEGETDFVPGPLYLADDELVERLGGTDVIPPGETRRFVVRFKSTTLVAHASLRVDADVWPSDYADGLGEGTDPEDQGGRIEGHVRNAAGDAVAGVSVSALRDTGTDHRGRFATATTGPDGAYTLDGLADGTYAVGIGSDPGNAADTTDAVIAAADRSPTVDLVAAVSDVVGTVRRPDGTRLANAEVTLLDADDRVVAKAPSDAGGGFSFAVVRPGTYALSAAHPTGGLARLDDLEIEAGASRTGLRLTTGTRSLAVTVRGPGNAPVTGARVIVRAPGGEPLQLARTTDGNGLATFSGLPAGAVPVEAHRSSFGSARAQPAGSEHTFTLAAGATVNGLVDSAGGPVPNAMVVAVATAGGLTQRAFAGVDGQYSFTTLAPGTYDLWFQGPGYAPQRLAGTVITAGTQTRNATLDTQGTIRPLALRAAGGGFVRGALFTIRHEASGAALVSVFAGPDGVADPGPLPIGEYLVDVSLPGSGPVTHDLTIAAPSRRRIDPTHELPPIPAATADRPFRRHEARYIPPYRSFWTQLEVPQLNELDRLGWDQVSAVYPTPCPRADRLYYQIRAKSRAKRVAFDAWLSAHAAISQANQQQVAEYLAKSAELGAKLYLAGVLMFEELPASVSTTQLAVLQAYIGGLSQYAQNQASGDTLSATDYAEKGQEALEIVREGLTEAGAHPESKALGNGFALLNALRDVIKLTKDVNEFPNNVRDRGEAYLLAQSQYLKIIRELNDLIRQYHEAVANCPDPDDDEPVPGPGGGGVIDNQAPNDPNDILGPAGVGAERWIARGQDLAYTVRFENVGPGSACLELDPVPPECTEASAPAVLVTIEHVLDDDVDVGSVELGDVGWGDVLVSVPAGLQSYHEDFPQADGDTVRVDGVVDVASREIRWEIATIDPDTGELETSPTAGFLPPEDGTGNGQGFVAFGARGADGLAHGTELKAKASIRFDVNPVIDTPEHTNTIDATAPAGAVSAAVQPGVGTAGCEEELAVQWGGTDTGSGVAGHDVWVSVDDQPFVPWLAATTATSATYAAASGHTYAFASVARDRVGNDEPLPATGDVARTVAECDETAPLAAATISGPAAQEGWHPGPVEAVLGAADNPGGFGVTQLVWSATGAKSGGATVGGDEVTVPIGEDGVTELAFHGADAAGNVGASRGLTVRVDTKPPAIDLRAPADGARLAVGEAATADFACADAGSGVAACDGSIPSGAPLDTSSPGERSVTVTARDRVGHTAEVTRTYSVVATGGDPPSPPGGGPPPPGEQPRRFARPPLTITVGKVTRAGIRLTLRNRQAFAVTGRGRARSAARGRKALTGWRAFSLRPSGRATVLLRLNAAGRRALRSRRAVRVTLTFELRAGALRRTATKSVRIRLRR